MFAYGWLSRLVLTTVIAVIGTSGVTAAQAKTFVVNDTSDVLGTNVGSGVCETARGNGHCTLRRALAEAREYRSGESRIVEAVIVVLPVGVFDLDATGTTSPHGHFDVSGLELTILGAGVGRTVINGHRRSVFFSQGGSADNRFRVSGLTIRDARTASSVNGDVRFEYVEIRGSRIGIKFVAGQLTLIGCHFTENGETDGGTALSIQAASGSASGATVRIVRSTFSGNHGPQGSAISLIPARVELDGVTVSGNSSTGSGGAIFVGGGGELVAVNTTLSGNSANESGGAIAVDQGSVALRHSTLTSNQADANFDGFGRGGGLAVVPSDGPARAALDHTILAGNHHSEFGSSGWVQAPGECFGPMTTTGPTLFGGLPVDCTVSGPAPVVGLGGLGPLQLNGGPTLTHALLVGSLAIDGGDPTGCHDASGNALAVDQRGFRRPAGGCDLGAVDSGGVAPVRSRSHDVDGDGRGDLVWRHRVTGDNAVWLMNGSTIDTAGFVTSVDDTGWDIVASEDFDGDGRADLLWRQRHSGHNAVWLMDGVTIREAAFLPTVEDTGWSVAGSGDFNGDGTADVLWRHARGRTTIWLMHGTSLEAAVALPETSSWDVVGVGDVNADDRADILWRRPSTGENALWMMDGSTVVDMPALPDVTESHWTVAVFADLSGDGKADIVWRNVGNGVAAGQTAVWLLDGPAIASAAYLATVSPTMSRLVQAVDTDGDGRADLIWRAPGGQNARWKMDGTTLVEGTPIVDVPDPNWALR